MVLPFQMDLSGKVIAVTGGGGILCSCIAEALGKCGAKVAVLDLRQDAAQAVASKITKDGGTAVGIECNVLQRESLEKAAEEMREKLGACDILINGAGGNHPRGTTAQEFITKDLLAQASEDAATFYDLDPEGVQFVFNLNFLGTLLPTQVFTRQMAASGSGTILNVSSMSAFVPLTKVPAYSAAKAAISNFTEWLAVYFAKAGIRVNAIAPGFFLTEQNRTLLTNPDGTMTERGRKIIDHTPMGRYGEPEDLIGTVLWLLSDTGAGFVTGTVIPIDGGFNAYSGV
mgnify:CR=1 FL=1